MIPLFALANGGIPLFEQEGAIGWSVVLGTMLGLVVGKPVGIDIIRIKLDGLEKRLFSLNQLRLRLDFMAAGHHRITSYNVCYTKLLRPRSCLRGTVPFAWLSSVATATAHCDRGEGWNLASRTPSRRIFRRSSNG